ncbi:MAG: FecR domain-containing protein [Cyanobacteria bacterium P01_D01_bin.156]
MKTIKLLSAGRWLALVGTSLGIVLSLPGTAVARSALTWARLELVRNQVQLVTDGQSRRAQVSDVLGINDALSTARRARAELRFNDGSLARIGESAIFRFTPNTRNFRLSNGTVLLLIPPGQGRTTIQTPNAVTGIRGSALFVRFIPETNTTVIGALTTNPEGPMMAFNEDGSMQQPLNAGEMAVVRGDGLIQHFEFDLKEFYSTSEIVSGLYLNDKTVSMNDVHIDAVRQETLAALEQQGEFEDSETDTIQENPVFLSSRPAGAVALNTNIPAFESSPAAAFLQRRRTTDRFAGILRETVEQPEPSLRQQFRQQPVRQQPVVAQPSGTTTATPPPTQEVPVKPDLSIPPTTSPNDAIIPSNPNQEVITPIEQPLVKPTLEIIPETVPETTIVPETIPETLPDSTVFISEPVPQESTLSESFILQESTALPAETLVPSEAAGFSTLENIEIIESATEPEVEAQLERLPGNIVQDMQSETGNVDGNSSASNSSDPMMDGSGAQGQGGNP